MIHTVSLKFPVNTITSEFIKDFEEASGAGNGKVKLKLRVYDPDEKLSINFFSRSRKINLTGKFIRFLKDYPVIELTIN